MARKFSASLSYRVATLRKCFSLEKKRSIRLRSRYSHVLKYGFDLRFALGGILANAPFPWRDARMRSASYALSASTIVPALT